MCDDARLRAELPYRSMGGSHPVRVWQLLAGLRTSHSSTIPVHPALCAAPRQLHHGMGPAHAASLTGQNLQSSGQIRSSIDISTELANTIKIRVSEFGLEI